ncbi:MAG: hypothetical protein ACREUA_05310 [Burkholderiales bacterium]
MELRLSDIATELERYNKLLDHVSTGKPVPPELQPDKSAPSLPSQG